MGKGILLVALAVIFSGAYILVGAKRTDVQADQIQADYQAQLLAKNIALSAYNRAVSELKRDFGKWRKDIKKASYDGGQYDIKTTGPAAGPVALAVEGRYGKARYRITATLSSCLNNFLDAVSIEADGAKGTQNGSGVVSSGYNHELNGKRTTVCPDVHGMRTPDDDSWAGIDGPFQDKAVVGSGGTRDYGRDPFTVDLDVLFAEAVSRTTVDFTELAEEKNSPVSYTGSEFICSSRLNNANAPEVFYAPASLTLKGNCTGYGVLVVNGNFATSGGSKWNGLILVQNASVVRLSTDVPDTYGAIVARARPDASGTTFLEYEMSGNANVHYSSEALLSYAGMLPTVQEYVEVVVGDRMDQGSDADGEMTTY